MRFIFLVAILVAGALSGPFSAAFGAAASESATYPLPICIVTGEPLATDGEPVAVQVDGREIRFCSQECVERFEKDAPAFLQQLDQAIIADQLPYYPLETCIVSGEALGAMGEPADHVIQNRLVRFCCDGCRPGFDKDRTKFLKNLDEAAIASQMKDYPADSCPVAGGKLGSMGEPFDCIVAGRLVRLCCAGCVDGLNKDPIGALERVYGDQQAKEAESQPKG